MILSTSNRTELNFAGEVNKSFEFLLNEYNFRCVVKNLTFVRYESELVFINVYHGRYSYEIGIEIGLLESNDKNDPGFTISELMNIVKPQNADHFMRPIARDFETVKRELLKLSKLFKRYAGKTLSGDQEIYLRLREQREQLINNLIKDKFVSQTKPKAYLAFKQKDFKKTVSLYQSIKEHLTPVELRKLEYAEKKIKERK